MEVRKFQFEGKQISYQSKGTGPVVMLLHGFAEDGTVWKRQHDLFPHHKLIIPDLPGSGLSELIDDMSMEGLAAVVYSLVQHEAGTEKITFIGHSMGGYIALAFAEKYPDALNGLGLFHSTAFADNEERKETRRKGIAAVREKGAVEFLKTTIPNMFGSQTKDERPEFIDEQIASVRNFSAEALVMYYEAMMDRPDRTEVLRNTKSPVLFVMGKYDTAVPMEDVLKQCHLPQLSYIHVLHHSGHMGMIEETEEANKILVQFVQTVEN